MTVSVRVPYETASRQGAGAHPIQFDIRLQDQRADEKQARAVEKSNAAINWPVGMASSPSGGAETAACPRL